MENKNLLTEYKKYYQVRYLRYEGNDIYKESTKIERQLFELVENSNSIDDLMQNSKGKELANNCSVANLLDIANFEYDWYNNKDECFLKLSSEKILKKIKYGLSANDAVTIANEIQAECLKLNSNDLIFRNTIFKVIEDLIEIEQYTHLDIPSKYSKYYQDIVDKLLEDIKSNLTSMRNTIIQNNNSWRFDINTIKEHRHRRLIVYSDETLYNLCTKINDIYQSLNL